MSKIGIKPESKTVDKGVVRTQKLIDNLRRDIEALKARVTALEQIMTFDKLADRCLLFVDERKQMIIELLKEAEL